MFALVFLGTEQNSNDSSVFTACLVCYISGLFYLYYSAASNESQGCGRTRKVQIRVCVASQSYLVISPHYSTSLCFSPSPPDSSLLFKDEVFKSLLPGLLPGHENDRANPVKYSYNCTRSKHFSLAGNCGEKKRKEKKPEMIHRRCLEPLLILKHPIVFSCTSEGGI